MTMEYIILEYRLSSEIDFSSLTYFSCFVKKKLPAACRGCPLSLNAQRLK